MEIDYGEFKRQIYFKAPIERAASGASYADGFLRVILPKSKYSTGAEDEEEEE